MQLDRSGVRRQFPALGQRSSLTSAGRILADLLGPTRCLTSFLEDTTNLLNGLLSQVPKALWRLVLGRIVPAHGCPTILGKPVNRLADRLQHGGAQPLRQPACRHRPWAWQGSPGLACSAVGTLQA